MLGVLVLLYYVVTQNIIPPVYGDTSYVNELHEAGRREFVPSSLSDFFQFIQ